MRSQGFVLSALSALALAAGLTLTSAPVFAKQGDSAQQSDSNQEQVTVVGPRIMRTKVRGTSDTGAGVGYYDLMTLSRHVSYSDLDLSKPEGAKRLKNRIRETASEICERLADAPPVRPQSQSQQCVHKAVANAMQEAHFAITHAER
jgi:UrcA family protein